MCRNCLSIGVFLKNFVSENRNSVIIITVENHLEVAIARPAGKGSTFYVLCNIHDVKYERIKPAANIENIIYSQITNNIRIYHSTNNIL